jgi:hypothetical protein
VDSSQVRWKTHHESRVLLAAREVSVAHCEGWCLIRSEQDSLSVILVGDVFITRKDLHQNSLVVVLGESVGIFLDILSNSN